MTTQVTFTPQGKVKNINTKHDGNEDSTIDNGGNRLSNNQTQEVITVNKEHVKIGITTENGGSTPSQYSFPEGATEIIDLIEHREMNFNVGNIFKAAYRIGHCMHSTTEYDLNKIIFFAQRELARIEKVSK